MMIDFAKIIVFLGFLVDTIPKKPRKTIILAITLQTGWMFFHWLHRITHTSQEASQLGYVGVPKMCLWECSDSWLISQGLIFTMLIFYARFVAMSLIFPNRALILTLRVKYPRALVDFWKAAEEIALL
eukprot:TRINITY_DN11874_c0_g1_i1.p1 TRINITY_DN11874_c0_g1~~TRINITY_DN11874_c0_g1_i1.p1  ORF type:complete len:128 (+),score=6.07 TRINITY_DN11874_c0_g1_i1:45-428(+)